MDILFQACPCPFSSLRTVDFNSEVCRFVSLVPATDSGSELSMVRQVDFDILVGHTISNDNLSVPDSGGSGLFNV